MSQAISYSVPSIGCGVMPFIVHLQTRSARARPLLVLQHFERHDAAEDLDALALGVLALALGRGHLLDREERGENRLHALAAQGSGDVVSRYGRIPR